VITGVDLMILSVLNDAAGNPPTLIGFQPPDSRWSQRVDSFRVNGEPVTCLNAFLADVRENRQLRSDAIAQQISLGQVTARHAPMRVDLHYLISAWHPVKDSDSVPATALEHGLLSRVITNLSRTPLNSDVVLTAAQAATLPDLMQSVDLPSRLLPPDGFPHLGEFWSAMGQNQSWRPTCYLIVTMPVVPPTQQAGGIVETILADSFATSGSGVALVTERTLAIGGLVHSIATGPTQFAAVELRGLGGGPAAGVRDTTLTDSSGHFEFAGLAPGTYEIAFSHPQHLTQPPVLVTVPLASGHVDLVFP
jgi:hypothetical protein